jgi:uncharacterized protein (DUF849 family)
MSDIIITCAITGSIHTPSMSPHLPVTPDEITDHAIGAAAAGASILHLHARDPETGHPSAEVDHFMAFLPRIHQACDAVLNLSTGGSAIMSLDQRLAANGSPSGSTTGKGRFSKTVTTWSSRTPLATSPAS